MGLKNGRWSEERLGKKKQHNLMIYLAMGGRVKEKRKTRYLLEKVGEMCFYLL